LKEPYPKGLALLAKNPNLEYNAPMHVQVKLFSHLRTLLPAEARGQIAVELSDGATVAYLLAYLGIANQVKLVTVNNEPEPARDRILCDRDVVRIFPPVVGG
jgi:sulfur carrier protein ThiS